MLGWPGPLTHRQYEAWQAWLDDELNRPSRADYYIMLAAHEARYAMAEKKQAFDSAKYKLEFRGAPSGAVPGPSREFMAAASKQIWLGRMALCGKEVRHEVKG